MLFAQVYEQQPFRKLSKPSTKLWGLGHATWQLHWNCILCGQHSEFRKPQLLLIIGGFKIKLKIIVGLLSKGLSQNV